MTPLDKIIFGRRSIRAFKSDIPDDEIIRALVQAGGRAPSPHHSEPVRFVRLVSPDSRRSLRDALELGKAHRLDEMERLDDAKRLKNWTNRYYRYSEFMVDAPLLFALCAIRSGHALSDRLSRGGVTGLADKADHDLDITVGLAGMNFILKATELGLGTCMLTAPFMFLEDPETVLGIDGMTVRCFICAGYADETPGELARKPFDEIYEER